MDRPQAISDAAVVHAEVKCDEKRPSCSQCLKGKRTCQWPEPDEKRARPPRRPNATACDACRDKKLKCIGNVYDICQRCSSLDINCVRSHQATSSAGVQSPDDPHSTLRASVPQHDTSDAGIPLSQNSQESESAKQSMEGNAATAASTGLGQLPCGKELYDLVQLYFDSVHQFGYFEFVHQIHFNRLLASGKAPRNLTLLMIASAMRFAGKPGTENLARADAWADSAIGDVRPRIYQGFGAIQLMTLLLAQHYDLNRGNFTSAWLLGADCTRMMQMMSLQTFDRTYSASNRNMKLSPLLSPEALRRLAWSTFYVDTVVDGGRYGFHTVDENAYRLQLPCDQTAFLSDETAVTENLRPRTSHPQSDDTAERSVLDMSAYLLRTAAARRRYLHFAFRATHREQNFEELSSELAELEADMDEVIAALPKRFHFNTDNLFLHKDRLITFLLLHVLRHNLFIVLGRAALQVYNRDATRAEQIPQVRQKRILHALPIAGLISEWFKSGICFDPQIGVHAYVALEILLFEPRRLAEIDPAVDPAASELMEAIPHLLTAVRDIADRSEFVKELYIQAVHRLLRCDCAHLLAQEDFSAFLSEYQLVDHDLGQDLAEYDFRDFRMAKLERLRRGASSSTNVTHDEALLEYTVGGETAVPSTIPSPRLDAMDVDDRLARVSTSHTLPEIVSNGLEFPDTQQLNQFEPVSNAQPWEMNDSVGSNLFFPLDWSWLLGESGDPGYQSGDPNAFWSQL